MTVSEQAPRGPEQAPRGTGRRGKRTPRRMQVLVLSLAALIPLVWLVREAFRDLPVSFLRAAFPFANNVWSEQPLYLQLLRFYRGGPLYDPMSNTGSYDYPPLYLLVVSALRWLFSLPFGVVEFRFLSIAIALLCLIPLAIWSRTLAERFGITRKQHLRTALVTTTAVLLGLAVITRDTTFDGLHPNALLFTLSTTIFALYYLVASRKLDGKTASYPFVALCLAAVFTKQGAVAVLPLLALGWAIGGFVSWKRAGLMLLAYLALCAGFVAIMPVDMRAWVLAPLYHPYLPVLAALYWQLVFGKPYFGFLFLVTIIYVQVVAFRRGPQTYAVAGLALLAALSEGVPAFFKRGGGWQDLTLVALLCVPYAAVLFGYAALPGASRKTRFVFRLAAIAVALFVVVKLNVPGRTAPGLVAYDRMQAAQAVVNADVCDRKMTVTTSIFPSLFVNCPNTTFGSVISWGEVLNTYIDRYHYPVALEQDPNTQIVVWLQYPLLAYPGKWVSKYRLLDSVPVVLGYVTEYYDQNATLMIYARNESR